MDDGLIFPYRTGYRPCWRAGADPRPAPPIAPPGRLFV